MKLFRVLKFLYKSEDPHFLSVDKEFFFRWRWLVLLAVMLNKNYVYCEIYRRKYKHLNWVVVVGLKTYERNVKRRVSGFAKEFISHHKDAKCIYCESKLDYNNATTDHIIPISEGGGNQQVNLMVCCKSCNGERGQIHFMEYLRTKNPKYKKVKYVFI